MTDRQLHLTFGSRYENIELVQTAIDEAVAEKTHTASANTHTGTQEHAPHQT